MIDRCQQKKKKKASDDLRISILSLLPDVNTLPILVVINLVKVKVEISFELVTRLHVIAFIMGCVTLWGKPPTCHV